MITSFEYDLFIDEAGEGDINGTQHDVLEVIDFMVKRIIHYLYEDGSCNCKSQLHQKLIKIKSKRDTRPGWVYAVLDFFVEPWAISRFRSHSVADIIRVHTGDSNLTQEDVDLANDIISIFVSHLVRDIANEDLSHFQGRLTKDALNEFLFDRDNVDDLGFAIEPLGPIRETALEFDA